MDTVIQTVDLHKNFGRVKALDGLDLEVHKGEIHGFLGPNGAGKTTTLRILLGLARPSSGSASVLGMHPWADAVELHRRVASIPGDVSLWPNLSGGEAIDLLSRLRGGGVDHAAFKERKHHLCELFDFDPGKKGRAYSKGNRQKVALISALVMDAELYLLDEPTSGLDPLMEAVFTREIRRIVHENGATVLLSSHILSEVEQLANRVSIIRAGRIVDGAHSTHCATSRARKSRSRRTVLTPTHWTRCRRSTISPWPTGASSSAPIPIASTRSCRFWAASGSKACSSLRRRSKNSSCATTATRSPRLPCRQRTTAAATIGATAPRREPEMGALWILYRHRLRRDRWQVIVWVLSIGMLALFAVAAIAKTFGDDATRAQVLQLATAAPAILVLRASPAVRRSIRSRSSKSSRSWASLPDS
ncbi:bacitracin transport ATP-binding protein BcrA [Arthrobacter sp. Hiyo8]|nr:bacitracin transport ATP-binding protein BcrA [Arthrobacter sp. Hiyo8]